MSENTTVTLNHPTIEGVTQVVPVESVKDWTEAGWLDGSEGEPKPGSKEDLINQAQALDLPTEGTKADLELRIAEANAQQ